MPPLSSVASPEERAMKQMVLHEKHLQLKARMSDFQGWQVAQAYTEVQDEYHAVRTTAGLFDISCLGRIEISGPGSREFLERLFTRNIARMPDRTAHYGLLCNEEGFILDDAVLFLLPDAHGDPRFLLTTNAMNAEKIRKWIADHAPGDVRVSDKTRDFAHFALQGPQSPFILEKLLGQYSKKFKPRTVREIRMADLTLLVCRTGYTGEHGYELIVRCGFASRDILRLEMGYRMYGNDIDATHTPVEAGLDHFVDFRKDFIGRDRLEALRAAGIDQRLAGFTLLDKNVPRNGGSIFSENREIGSVTSGAFSPSLRKGIGLGYVVSRYAQPGQEIEIEIRDREFVARIAEVPFYKKK
jgi:aminomethyltransferase